MEQIMEKLKHTFGPWKIEETDLHEFNLTKDGWTICTVWNGVEGFENLEDNSRLISAAPGMLEYLIEQAIFDNVETDGISERLADIIEKATGLKIEELFDGNRRV